MLKGNNNAKIFFTEVIVLLFDCDTLKIPKLCKDEEKNLKLEAEGANLEEDNYLSSEKIMEFVGKLKCSRIDKNNKPELILIKNELDRLNLSLNIFK